MSRSIYNCRLVLTPLRAVLHVILEGEHLDRSQWARLIAVGEALRDLIAGNKLAHPSDVLLQAAGGIESSLLQDDTVVPDWYRDMENLRGILRQVRSWPTNMLPTFQQAALNLVSAISALIPEEQQSGVGDWQPKDWWYLDRHHGLGDTARHSAPPSPRQRGTRRPRNPSGNSSDQSHRRRRVLAEHVHGHGL